MIDTPHITTTSAQPTARIRLTVPRSEIQQVMGPGIGEVMSTVAAQGIAVTGPWFTHHLRMDPTVFDFEICVPVASEVAPSGRVQPGAIPAARVARTTFHGDYAGLGAGWGEFLAWIAANGHTPADDLLECYVKGPESGADSAEWCTQLTKPLKG